MNSVNLLTKFNFKVFRPCKECKEVKEISNFTKSKGCRWDRGGKCKKCTANYAKKKYHTEEYKQTRKDYIESGRKKEVSKKYNNSEKGKNTNKKYYTENKELIDNTNKKYYQENKEKLNEYKREYDKRNPQHRAKSKAKRRTAESNATPNWADQSKIKDLYLGAKRLEELTGLKYEVDHIEPLKGNKVCGLHVWENLQILESTLNRKKSNKENYYIKIEEK